MATVSAKVKCALGVLGCETLYRHLDNHPGVREVMQRICHERIKEIQEKLNSSNRAVPAGSDAAGASSFTGPVLILTTAAPDVPGPGAAAPSNSVSHSTSAASIESVNIVAKVGGGGAAPLSSHGPAFPRPHAPPWGLQLTTAAFAHKRQSHASLLRPQTHLDAARM
jgi:hypothetical protein